MSIRIFLTNLGKYNEGYLIGQWMELPVSEDKLDKALKEIGINDSYEEYFITDYETDITGIENVIGEYSSIVSLNELAESIDNLSSDDEEKLEAVMECESCRGVSDVLKLIEQLDNYDLLSGIDNDEALGYYFAEELCCIGIPEQIKSYFDYEAYGRDIRLEGCCTYTKLGCLLCNE